MSEPLLKLIVAQRLLAEIHELLEADALTTGFRDEADRRAEGIRLSGVNGQPETCQTNSLEDLIERGCKFRTIYADPPWHYTNAASRGAAQNHYDTMTIESIAGLPVQQLAADEAHLHLWTTNAFLFDAKQVIEAWGFTYKSCLVWIKPQLGNGNYWRVSHEFLLLGVRSNLTFADRTQQSWICAERTQHSAKPRIFQTLIEHVSPPPRLELFARTQSDGWTTWGNQIQRSLFDDLQDDRRTS
jgi:N6-adenosine-specific RNA methylase IME4